jgi:hypothetical protein
LTQILPFSYFLFPPPFPPPYFSHLQTTKKADTSASDAWFARHDRISSDDFAEEAGFTRIAQRCGSPLKMYKRRGSSFLMLTLPPPFSPSCQGGPSSASL